MSRVTPVYRTEDEVRDEAKLILGFDKIEDGIKTRNRTDYYI